MDRLSLKSVNQTLRHKRVRSKVSGTSERPRMSIHISNRNIIAQVIDDTNGRTLVYVTSVGNKSPKGTFTDIAAAIGTEIAKQAKTKKIKAVVFDRGSKLYHGRIKALADAARAEGLEF